MASPVSVALLTDLLTGSIDEDHEPLRRALAEVGVVGELVAWDDPAATPAAVAACHGLVVIRSPWDYPRHADRYLAALDALAAAVPVCNEPALVRWNIDKRYLADLAGAGIAVVATRFVGPDEDPVPVCRQAAGAGQFVVKPTVSAGCRDTARYRPEQVEQAVAHVAALQAEGRAAMVQPYLHGVDAEGETALVYLDGRFSHGLRKGPLLRLDAGFVTGLFAAEDMSEREPSAEQLAVGDAVLAFISDRFGVPLYARIDLIDDAAGRPVVLEVELNEPSLFHTCVPASAARFAAAIAARLRERPGGPS